MWLLRIFFNQLYHGLAWSYDLVAAIVSGGRWKRWVTSVIPYIQGKSVLELGVGTGALQQALTAAGFLTYGVDQSLQMLRIAKDLNSTHHLSHRLLRALSEALPLATNSVDTIVATFPSEYIFQPETLRACRQVLRPGGRLVVLLGVRVGGNGLVDRMLRILYKATGQGTPDLDVLEKSLAGLSRYGFKATIENLRYQQDSLTVILAV
jgi:ubiquinone/menaquinone biosynthesis C-methylase UbiE